MDVMDKAGVPAVTLSDGRRMPQVGFGLWKVTDQNDFNKAFTAAVGAGYRHFDTAQAYGNEAFLGQALQGLYENGGKDGELALSRQDIWITTKIAVQHFGHTHALKSFDDSLKHLQTPYVDLLLLHFPVSLLRKKTWQALEELQAAGKAKSIGVSNFTIKHLEEMQQYAKIMPVVNQVELHVFLQQPELVEYCRKHNITVEAYSPLAHARAMDEPIIGAIAQKHGKSYAQIMLRWCIEKGFVVLPKSVTPERIASNIALFDFGLDQDDMKQLASLDRGLRTCWDPTLVP